MLVRNAVTVADDKTKKTLTVTQFAEINVNGKKATIADLKARLDRNRGNRYGPGAVAAEPGIAL